MSFDISDDESLVLLMAGLASVVVVFRWFLNLRRIASIGCPPGQRRPLYLAPIVGLGLVLLTLVSFASHEIKDNGIYVVLFMVAGIVWLTIAASLFRLLGVGLREDALENHNQAAIMAISGGILAVSLTYAGGNIGEGPTIWTTFFPALVATGALLVLWAFFEFATHVSEAITIERDMASGIRLAGLLIAEGLILGRSVAGDWISAEATVRDFVEAAWPAALLVVVAAIVQWRLRPTATNLSCSVGQRGWLPAGSYLLGAVLYVLSLGSWNAVPVVVR